jgi:hypothetical protein
MANRAIAAKVERAKRQAREAAAHEYGKAPYMGWRDGVGVRPAELRELTAKYLASGGRIKRVPCTGTAPSNPVKGGCILGSGGARSMIAPGRPYRAGVHYYTA